mgnify:CR=1 FL=1
MLYDVNWAEDGTYRPGEYNSPERFFNDGLRNSTEFDLQLGYFSSAAISVLADGFATFIVNGGRMRLVINHIVSESDKNAISKGVYGGLIDCFDLTDFESLRQTLDEYQQQFFECLAFLIYNKRIDIRIICPRNRRGIAHTKSGQFRDGDSVTSFTGSANFTVSGLFNNIEEIKIDRSDSIDTMVRKRIECQRVEFESIMSHQKGGLEYLSPKELEVAVVSTFGGKDVEELLDVERKLKNIKERRTEADRSDVLPMVCEDNYTKEPHFPYPSGPREYQHQAFENWKSNGQKGLFAMATGTGKTITSLNCLLEIYKRKGYYKAIILVPTQTLVEQWVDECKKFDFSNVYTVYSKNKNWRNEVDLLHLKEDFNRSGCGDSFIIISTYSSFVRDNVFSSLNSFSKNRTLLIADEAHNMGSRRMQDRMDSIRYLRRIGLSATPYRQFDDLGNQRINTFFGSTDGFTFEYSMREAIDNDFLCRYYYYPHVVRLNDAEMADYLRISRQLSKFFSYDRDSFAQGNDILTALLLKRKRIIHKAQQKEPVFEAILKERYKEKGNLKYTLVYVPEGNRPDAVSDLFETTDALGVDEVSEHLIDRYTQMVYRTSPQTTVREFTSDSRERTKLLDDFACGRLEVLTSMKCLDEGVDVPRSEMAIFCASTGNPRQFVQRRGRILRKHKDKHRAIIHDLIVAPWVSDSEESYNMERSLLEIELKRVRDFASLSENADYTYRELEETVSYYNLSIL